MQRQHAEQVAGGVFLIGLAVLFMTGAWWPGIMFVIGASSLARGLAQGNNWHTMQGGLWMIGIGLMFLFGFNIGVLLLVIGLSMLFGYMFRPPFLDRSKSAVSDLAGDFATFDAADKPKRKLKNADGLLYYDEEDDLQDDQSPPYDTL
ncbi:MAG: hypothetical protein Kow0077_10910 [Anaerolineae bacterium]